MWCFAHCVCVARKARVFWLAFFVASTCFLNLRMSGKVANFLQTCFNHPTPQMDTRIGLHSSELVQSGVRWLSQWISGSFRSRIMRNSVGTGASLSILLFWKKCNMDHSDAPVPIFSERVFILSAFALLVLTVGSGFAGRDPEQPCHHDQLHERGRIRESERHLPAHRHRKRAVAYRAHHGGHPRAIRYAWLFNRSITPRIVEGRIAYVCAYTCRCL